jgi:hypothetical protein
MKTTKTAVMLLLGLFVVAPASWANNQSANSKPLIIDLDCLDGPKVCRERAAKKEALRQQCTNYPEWCQQWHTNQVETREERRALREACKINPNPNECQRLKGQFKGKKGQRRKAVRQKLKEAQQQWCEDNPTLCKQWKADRKKVQQQCNELRRQLAEKYSSRPQRH